MDCKNGKTLTQSEEQKASLVLHMLPELRNVTQLNHPRMSPPDDRGLGLYLDASDQIPTHALP